MLGVLSASKIRLAHGDEWNAESEALLRVRLVCGGCYEEIKERNVLGNRGEQPSTVANDAPLRKSKN
jgi:hypothetical protein